MGRHSDPLSKSEMLRHLRDARLALREIESLVVREHTWYRAGYSRDELADMLEEHSDELGTHIAALVDVLDARREVLA